MAVTQLRGGELLRFIDASKRTPKNQRKLSAYEIFARSGYEKRPEKDIKSYSVTSYIVERFVNRYCQALIEKYGIPQRLEDPFTEKENKEFTEDATPPKQLIEAVQKLKVTMSAFRAGYISHENDRIIFEYDQFSQACEVAKRKEKMAKKDAEDRKAKLEEKARKVS